MANTHRAPKQWSLTKHETVNSFENWKQNLLYTLSLDTNFATFLADGATWGKRTRATPLRGFENDGEDVARAQRKTAAQKGLQFEAVPSTFEENLDKSLFPHPSDYVKENARLKALEVANKLAGDQIVPDLVIGADTVVAMDNTIYEKPKSRDDAINMLTGFSGRSHTVYTGIALVSPSRSSVITSGEVTEDGKFRLNLFHEATDVMMTDLTQEVVKMYIDTGEPMDKAGGYGIQAIGGTLVKGIRGDYFNVMGFPLHSFSLTLASLYQSQHSQT